MCQQCPRQGGHRPNVAPVVAVIVVVALLLTMAVLSGAAKNNPVAKILGSKQGGATLAGILGGFGKDVAKGGWLGKIELGNPFSNPKGKGNVCPVDGKVKFSDTWGASRSNGRRRHKGVDMFAKSGTKLVAVTNGRVIRAGSNPLGGLGVTIRDKRGTSYYYAHNSRNHVRVGQRVRKGQLVARVGNTGNARHTPPHVHFEVRPHGRPVNPTNYVKAWC